MNVKIFTDNIEGDALNQIYTLAGHPAFSDAKIRIMPDVHAGKGCVIGFTADLGDKVVPNLVGVDIGCGMLTTEIEEKDIDFAVLDAVIRDNIPSGRNVREHVLKEFPQLRDLRCLDKLKNLIRIEQSLGTLGGGNHFIEVDESEDGRKYLVIHTGSRNLGKQVCEIYQRTAIDDLSGKNDFCHLQNELIRKLKAEKREREISSAIEELKRTFRHVPGVPKELAYLTGELREDYLHDMYICQKFAASNRALIAEIIFDKMRWHKADSFETVHNYIENNIIRKGAIAAYKGERVLIPMNMRDGCIIGTGKGNEDWNCSAPHGAGRLFSRSAAKELISLDEFRESMKGIFTTSVSDSTIDESPMAYKPMEDIVRNIGETVEIGKVIKPVYNFKSSE